MKLSKITKNMVSLKKWKKGFNLKKFIEKFVTGVVTSALAILTPETISRLSEAGISFDSEKAKQFLIVTIVGLLLGLINTAKHGPLKEDAET
jgi:hypothetical protein